MWKKETKLKQKPWISKVVLTSVKIKIYSIKNICENKIFFWYERYKFYKNKINKVISKSKKLILGSFFKIIFKILDLHGKELMNYSIKNQIKMMSFHL